MRADGSVLLTYGALAASLTLGCGRSPLQLPSESSGGTSATTGAVAMGGTPDVPNPSGGVRSASTNTGWSGNTSLGGQAGASIPVGQGGTPYSGGQAGASTTVGQGGTIAVGGQAGASSSASQGGTISVGGHTAGGSGGGAGLGLTCMENPTTSGAHCACTGASCSCVPSGSISNPGSCDLTCSAPSQPCAVDCPGGSCKTACAAGTTCKVACGTLGGGCRTSCDSGATCSMDCTRTGNCTMPCHSATCTIPGCAGACSMECTGDKSNCHLVACQGGCTITTCSTSDTCSIDSCSGGWLHPRMPIGRQLHHRQLPRWVFHQPLLGRIHLRDRHLHQRRLQHPVRCRRDLHHSQLSRRRLHHRLPSGCEVHHREVRSRPERAVQRERGLHAAAHRALTPALLAVNRTAARPQRRFPNHSACWPGRSRGLLRSRARPRESRAWWSWHRSARGLEHKARRLRLALPE
jgi:hypothetical protein